MFDYKFSDLNRSHSLVKTGVKTERIKSKERLQTPKLATHASMTKNPVSKLSSLVTNQILSSTRSSQGALYPKLARSSKSPKPQSTLKSMLRKLNDEIRPNRQSKPSISKISAKPVNSQVSYLSPIGGTKDLLKKWKNKAPPAPSTSGKQTNKNSKSSNFFN